MLSRIVRSSATQLFSHHSVWQSSAIVTSRAAVQMRHFSEKLSIPTDEQHQYGRRKEELEAEDVGQVGFNREPIIPPDNAGTKENPILVSNCNYYFNCIVYTSYIPHHRID